MPSSRPSSRPALAKLAAIKMIILDVDGVLTDGRIIFGSDGTEYKLFDAHDGYGITRARAFGMKFAVISGKSSPVTLFRMKKLGINELHQNQMNKVTPYRKIKSRHKLKDEEICYIGDDDFDVPLLKEVGFSAAPRDAMASVRRHVDYVTAKHGGRGAVREVIDLILRAKRLV